jgi:hypothetical protein
MNITNLLLVSLLGVVTTASALANPTSAPAAGRDMYLIERTIPGAGKLTPEQLKGISQTSCGVLKEMGPEIQWVQSYVTGDKIYCVYLAANEELVREHARRGGFPADAVNKVATIISPKTAE